MVGLVGPPYFRTPRDFRRAVGFSSTFSREIHQMGWAGTSFFGSKPHLTKIHWLIIIFTNICTMNHDHCHTWNRISRSHLPFFYLLVILHDESHDILFQCIDSQRLWRSHQRTSEEGEEPRCTWANSVAGAPGVHWILHQLVICYITTHTGWWFGTFFIFHNMWDNPSHWLIFFKMVETTNQHNWCQATMIWLVGFNMFHWKIPELHRGFNMFQYVSIVTSSIDGGFMWIFHCQVWLKKDNRITLSSDGWGGVLSYGCIHDPFEPMGSQLELLIEKKPNHMIVNTLW